MKKFITYTLLFFTTIFVLDFGFGKVCKYLNSHAKGGDTASHFYIANKSSEDVFVLGSSRAIHHYIPSILEDSLNCSVYNGGFDGNGIIFLYGRLELITQRYCPSLVIYEITPAFDIAVNDNHKYLDWQKRFYDSPNIDSIFYKVDAKEKYKMLSNLYRYNSSFTQMLVEYIHPMQTVLFGGYKPLYGKMNYEPKQKSSLEGKTLQWDPIKKYYFKKLVQLCESKNISLVFAISPSYKAESSQSFDLVKNFCNEHSLEIIDNYTDSEIAQNQKYFADPLHLNNDGATVYTKKFATQLKKTKVWKKVQENLH